MHTFNIFCYALTNNFIYFAQYYSNSYDIYYTTLNIGSILFDWLYLLL